MNNFSFFKLTASDKRKFILTNLIVYVLIVAMFIIAMNVEKLSLPTSSEKYSASIGFMILAALGFMAVFNRIKVLFKVRFIGFLALAVIFTLLERVISTVILGAWLMLIPLALDDLVFRIYWRYKWYKYYE